MQSSGITLPHLQVKLAKICCRDVPIPKKYAVMFIGYVHSIDMLFTVMFHKNTP
jgi:hypothetical protein